MLQKIIIAHFSPTGGTRAAALCLAAGLGEQVREVDLSRRELAPAAFGPEDVVILAGPVFGGRIPGRMAEQLKLLRGGGARCIAAAVYGNRHYDDALLELCDLAEAAGFRVTAASALLAEHSMLRQLAAGRPDGTDAAQLMGFAAKILDKLASGADTPVSVPGNRPYKEYHPLPTVPSAGTGCVSCGLCAEQCPVGAIPVDAPHRTDGGTCILCARCVALCPVEARRLPEQAAAMLAAKLAPCLDVRRENELYI